jgi:transmembrane sensor
MDLNDIQHIIQDYFDGITPKSYEKRIRQWLVSSANSTEKDSVLKEIWDQTEAEDANTQKALAEFQSNRREYEWKHRYHKTVRRVLKWAAVLALPILGAALTWLYSGKYYERKQLVEFYVPEGKIDSLVLSDGTKMIVNSGSTVLYPQQFNKHTGNRNVYLLGEAHFAVAKDKDHPFIVHSGKLNIQVLGTHFNVKAYTNEELITTTLEEGKVKLFDDNYTEVMKPNEQIVYSREDGRMSKNVVDVAKFNDWTTGDMTFDNQSLNEILTKIGLRYDVKFILDASIDRHQRFTMNFKHNETITDVLDVFTHLSHNLKYHKKGKTIIFYKNRKEGPQ